VLVLLELVLVLVGLYLGDEFIIYGFRILRSNYATTYIFTAEEKLVGPYDETGDQFPMATCDNEGGTQVENGGIRQVACLRKN
jgi:hypothetical protein